MTDSTSLLQSKEYNGKNTQKEENKPRVVETHHMMSFGLGGMKTNKE